MDNDLSRSVRFLEDAINSPARYLPRRSTTRREVSGYLEDLSCTIQPHELEALLANNQTFYDRTMHDILTVDRSVTGEIIHKRTPWKTTVDNLYLEFFEILQTQTSSHDALETVSELARCCSDALNVVRGLMSNVPVQEVGEEKWLEKERDTWRLIFILFQDRLMAQNLMEDENLIQYFGKSERKCIENLFKRESLVRECQLVIDWLEAGARERDNIALHFDDSTVGWENTLHQLQSPETIAFTTKRQIVDKLDPDAPHYQEKPLHDIDIDDSKKLNKKIMIEIRCGQLDEAQKLVRQCGHSWKAAIFEGWKLLQNPNEVDIEEDGGYSEMESDEVFNVEGNGNRDVWKSMAIRYAKLEYVDIYERAAVATFCGYIQSMLLICSNWEDYLWAYLKTMVDIRVESEIRDCCTKDHEYLPLPEEYWLQRMSLNEVFDSLDSAKSKPIREESKEYERLIQKYIILDEIPTLMKELKDWSRSANISTHFLRFITHIALFFDQTGLSNDRDNVEVILEAYINRLMDMKETQLVAFYISKLGNSSRVFLYAKYLENITDQNERKTALNYAEEVDLDVLAITKKIVENIRNRPQDPKEIGQLHHKLSDEDKLKISAIDWLLFYDSQKAELLSQSNAIVFNFLLFKKIDAAQLAFNKIPSETVTELSEELEDSNKEINVAIKEYLSYKAYLDAYEAFNEWFKQIKCKPTVPEQLPETAAFSEKVAYQHRVSQYEAEVERWKLSTMHMAKVTKALLYNVLLFPEGWLVVGTDSDYLRKTVIPEVTLLLYSVLYESDMHEECAALADLIASEQHCLYKEFSKSQLEEVFRKVVDVSLALLEKHRDPWGYDLVL